MACSSHAFQFVPQLFVLSGIDGLHGCPHGHGMDFLLVRILLILHSALNWELF